MVRSGGKRNAQLRSLTSQRSPPLT
jgi:hypothetical protein